MTPTKRRLLAVAGAMLLPALGWAQHIQNMDISFSAGYSETGSHVIPGSNVTVDGARGVWTGIRYGYQFARTSAGSVWLEIGQTYFLAGRGARASLPGSVQQYLSAHSAGLRLMVPVHSRVSMYGLAGGGMAIYQYPVIGEGAKVTSNSTIHGLFEFGGGVDVRLTNRISVRGELRDLLTGRGAGGSTGRNHPAPLFGIAAHF